MKDSKAVWNPHRSRPASISDGSTIESANATGASFTIHFAVFGVIGTACSRPCRVSHATIDRLRTEPSLSAQELLHDGPQLIHLPPSARDRGLPRRRHRGYGA